MSQVDVMYSYRFFTPSGSYLGATSAVLQDGMQYQRRENYVTSVALEFATEFFDKRGAWVEPWAMLAIYASVNGRTAVLQERTVWFLLAKRRTWSQQEGRRITLFFLNANFILNSRVVAYASGAAQADKSGQIDDLVKQVIRENLGSDATDSARDASTHLEIAADLPSGTTASVDYAFSYTLLRRVIDTLATKSFQAGTVYLYDVEPVFAGNNISKLRFVAFVGLQGVARSVTFSPENGNVASYAVLDDWRDEVNAYYVGGSGTGASRNVEEREDAGRQSKSPFGRLERFKSQPRLSTDGALHDYGDAMLEQGRPLRTFDIEVAEAPDSIYGVNWAFGDSVQYQIEGETGTARVAAVAVGLAGKSRRVRCFLTTAMPIGHQYSGVDEADIEA